MGDSPMDGSSIKRISGFESRALGLAQEVQQSLLPQSDPSLRGFDVAIEI